MNRQKGLLAFLCTAIALACALVQVPLVSGFTELGNLFSESSNRTPPPLAVNLQPPSSPKMHRGPGAADPITVSELKTDQRPDEEIRALSAKHGLAFGFLKANLAVTSQGVASEDGMLWPRLPEGDDEAPNDGLARTRLTAAFLERYRSSTGSTEGSLMAWNAGVVRSRHVVDHAGPGIHGAMAAMRLHMLAFFRSDVRRHLCTVWGLTLALDAEWPVPDSSVSGDSPVVKLTAPAGTAVRAPMPGRVEWAGPDGSRGLCVEISHACELRSVLCGLSSVDCQAGRMLNKGSSLGKAGPDLRFELWLGAFPLHPTVLREPEQETHGPSVLEQTPELAPAKDVWEEVP